MSRQNSRDTPEQIARLPNVGLAASALGAPALAILTRTRRSRRRPRFCGTFGAEPSSTRRQQSAPRFFLDGSLLKANGSPLRGSLPDVDVPMVERIAAGQSSTRKSWHGCRNESPESVGLPGWFLIIAKRYRTSPVGYSRISIRGVTNAGSTPVVPVIYPRFFCVRGRRIHLTMGPYP